jgi:uncharacterized protein
MTDHDSRDIEAKLARLTGILGASGSMVVAVSGGVDSAVLLLLAARTLDRVEAATVRSPFTPRRDLEDAERIGRLAGVRHHWLEADERREGGLADNPPDRCFHCKRLRFSRLNDLAATRGLTTVADGTNADDSAEDRPGMRAAAELGVASPLREAGLTKADLRALARRLDLPVADKPAAACLATRIEFGRPLDQDLLDRIDRAEDFLHDLGFGLVRCRARGGGAVIEVAPDQIDRLIQDNIRRTVERRLKELGFDRVTVNPDGYQGQIA